MIATPRDQFVCCTPDDSLPEIAERNTEKFDFLPVVEGAPLDVSAPIVGVVRMSDYFHEPAPPLPVSSQLMRLNERLLIGFDASILAFIVSADKRPFRFLVAAEGIVGLVSLTDLHKLPVRAALFGLVTGLEIAMSDLIRQVHDRREDWETCLSQERRRSLTDRIGRDKANEGIVDPLLYTQFCDKRVILEKSVFQGRPERNEFREAVKRIENLRNDRECHPHRHLASLDRQICQLTGALTMTMAASDTAIRANANWLRLN
ncbi:hypothetical protein DCO57_21045 [Labrenzia sp. 011]|nr:hypothetical protein DCO57_21045 [Labrenzia sp. 011]